MENRKPFRMLNPRLDANFKAIFTQDSEDSRKALKSFLSAAIGRKVESVTVVKNDEPRHYELQRGVSYDINCTFDDGEKAQIEMQSRDEGYEYGKRAEYCYVVSLVKQEMRKRYSAINQFCYTWITETSSAPQVNGFAKVLSVYDRAWQFILNAAN